MSIKFELDKDRIKKIIEMHGLKTAKQAVELSQKKSLQKLKTELNKDIRQVYNVKQSDLSKKINVIIDYRARADKNNIRSPYVLQIKDQRMGFAVSSYKQESSILENGAVQVKKVRKFNRFGIKSKKRKREEGRDYLAVSVEVKKGQRKDLLPGHATLALAKNYYGAFARGQYIGKQFSKGTSGLPFSRLWSISAGNMANTSIRANKKKYDLIQKDAYEKELERILKLKGQKFQRH